VDPGDICPPHILVHRLCLIIKHQNHLDKWAGVHFPYTSASFDGRRSEGNAARSSLSNGTSKMVASIGSFPTNKQRPASTTDPTEVSVASSSTRTREIVCHKCHGHGHIAAQYPTRRTMLLNEKGEWESDNDPENDGPKFDEEIEQDENEI
jgi:hypothetical protein